MSRNARSRRYKLRREQFLLEVADSFRCSIGELRLAYQRFNDERQGRSERRTAVYSGDLMVLQGGVT